MGGELLRVLLIDDSPGILARLQEILQERFPSVELVAVENLTLAQSFLKTSTPDVIISEWQLEDGNCLELFVAGQPGAGTPFIILTTHNDLRAAVAATKAGGIDYFLKSNDFSTALQQVVAEMTVVRNERQDAVNDRFSSAGNKSDVEKFRTFFECAAAGMVTISLEGRLLQANQAFCLFTGYSRTELVELAVADITHPDDLQVTAQNYKRLREEKSRAISYRKRFVCKEGLVKWGHVSVAAVSSEDGHPRYYIGLVQDITEYKLVHDQIYESKQMLQLVLDYIPQYVFWKDRDSVYLGCNRNFAKGAGVDSPQQLIGKTDFDLPWTQEEAQFYRDCDRRVIDADQPELHIVETQHQANGKQIWVDTNKIPLHDTEGNVVGILGTFEDITERKRAQDELVKTNRELDAFVYSVSHDLRTPLTPIIGYAEALREEYRGQLDEQAIDWLTKIESQSRRMLAVMEDLLKLARVGHVEQPSEPIDTDRVLEELLVEMGGQIIERGAEIKCSALPSLRVPATLLTQLFDNLITNALRYGGVEGSPIEISGVRKGGLVCLCVRDHGPGIRLDEREEVFELFYRGAASRHLSGTGIGLATVQKIARLYGGRAWVEETPGGGCTIRIELRNV